MIYGKRLAEIPKGRVRLLLLPLFFMLGCVQINPGISHIPEFGGHAYVNNTYKFRLEFSDPDGYEFLRTRFSLMMANAGHGTILWARNKNRFIDLLITVEDVEREISIDDYQSLAKIQVLEKFNVKDLIYKEVSLNHEIINGNDAIIWIFQSGKNHARTIIKTVIFQRGTIFVTLITRTFYDMYVRKEREINNTINSFKFIAE